MSEATPDLSFLQARPIFTLQAQDIALWLVGAGGTGSFLARHMSRLAWLLQTQHRKQVSVTFVDHDVVEPANVLRQDFCQPEIGLPKARALALRYTAAFGIEIQTILERFHRDMLVRTQNSWKTLTIICGAVDNAQARQAIAEALQGNARGYTQEVPQIWYLDCGNALEAGQVLLGSTNNREELADAFKLPGYCRKLPSPIMQHPELLVPLPEELTEHTLSCEQLLLANAQSLMVNQQVAAYAAEMLYELLVTQRLKRFATYFHQSSGTASSRYISPMALAQAIGKDEAFFSLPPAADGGADEQ